MIIETRNATIDDALFIAENIRPADVAELAAAGYTDIKAAVECSFSTSKKCRVATVDGIPVAILGVCDSAIKGVGVIWMLGTDGIYSISKRFLLGSKAELAMLREGYSQLVNFVHGKNLQSIRWLRWLGFEISPHPSAHNEQFFYFWQEF